MGNLRGCGVRVVLFCAALILTAVAATPASAQTFRGTILGTVTDTSGAASSQRESKRAEHCYRRRAQPPKPMAMAAI